MEHQTTNLEETKDPRLPGAMIMFSAALSTGSTENEYGVGDMDISLHRPGNKYPWIDLGRINFSNPTQKQYLDAEISDYGTDGRKAFLNINRRVSKIQAEYIALLIREMLMKEFNGAIPPDDEIQDLMKQRFQKGHV